MEEIQNLLHTEIQPKLASLRDKKRDYLEFQKLETELSQIQCFLTAYDYWACSNKVTNFEQESSELKNQIMEHEQLEKRLKDENVHIANMIETLAAKKQDNGGAFYKLEAEVKELSKEYAKINTQVDLKASSIKEESDALKAMEKIEKMMVPNVDALHATRAIQQERVNGLRKTLQKIEKDIQAHLFHYTNHARTIDPADVRGIVAELIQVPPEHLESVTAIETCAGGRLYNVIVSTDSVGAKLLDSNQTKLSKRTNLIPLNKITSANIDPSKIKSAKELAPGKVELALNLLQFEADLLNAMKFVFGNTLICKDSSSAKQVTFSQNVRMRSVTLDGDIYEPSGTLSGGSRNKSSNTLAKFQEYTKLRKELSAEEKALERLSEEICSAETVLGEYQKAEKKLELATHECALLEKQIESNANSQAIFQVENIQKEIDVETQRIEDSKSAVAELTERCKSLELEMRKFSTHKEETLGALKKEIQEEKKALVEETKKIQAEELKVQTLVQERIQLQQEMQTFETTETSLKATISGLMAEQEALKEKQSNMKVRIQHKFLLITLLNQDIIKSMEEKLSMERKTMLSHDTEMQAFEKTLKSNQKKIADQAGVLMRLRTEFENGSIECKKAASLLKEVTNNPENAWISDLKTQFGVDGGRFDFAKHNIVDLRKKVVQLTERHKATSRTLDRTVMEQFDRIEKKESSLVTKISTVMKDKNKIEETIDSLEKYKIDKLLKTWEKVSHDFGLIFGDLLPGNSAKLTPADGKNIGSGLEVQVCLGGVWKENLTELSGGQRSLVALSLILALLQFKPAPMYILDEVDSALDESHTQNIGQLLKNRFKGAQFILVSLKDGMYTNANVLFRTKFRDGVSTIERFAQNNSAIKGKGRT
ncbi:hypothetical protein BCR33DRAFT_449648 [Rhizoclosmatium globosum]|uniref:SMC hinge domain-containing protein n=1 Tax=Rhizoclosmatium globosum TaxID=329046 RepID=A0A1Y2BSE5_9FUNG|nr:hypothetical protein BCR33DRAFT_449648 [Rhizoclosmatium globosum]|eukprot:ORY37682.1 hypothetical protein BCR33DRAFT_449648 [Rhizoclosmatium globosum]